MLRPFRVEVSILIHSSVPEVCLFLCLVSMRLHLGFWVIRRGPRSAQLIRLRTLWTLVLWLHILRCRKEKTREIKEPVCFQTVLSFSRTHKRPAVRNKWSEGQTVCCRMKHPSPNRPTSLLVTLWCHWYRNSIDVWVSVAFLHLLSF